jgi:hypothetical protein
MPAHVPPKKRGTYACHCVGRTLRKHSDQHITPWPEAGTHGQYENHHCNALLPIPKTICIGIRTHLPRPATQCMAMQLDGPSPGGQFSNLSAHRSSHASITCDGGASPSANGMSCDWLPHLLSVLRFVASYHILRLAAVINCAALIQPRKNSHRGPALTRTTYKCINTYVDLNASFLKHLGVVCRVTNANHIGCMLLSQLL